MTYSNQSSRTPCGGGRRRGGRPRPPPAAPAGRRAPHAPGARGMGVGRLPALLAGILAVTLPFFAKLQGELPILMVAGTLAALDGAVRFGRDGRARDAAAVAAGMIAQALCCQQLALYGALLAFAACVVAGKQQRFSRATMLRLGGAVALSALVLYALWHTPLAVHRQLGFARDEELVRSLSATPGDFLTR